jgi:hypothetical protein
MAIVIIAIGRLMRIIEAIDRMPVNRLSQVL